MAKYKSKPYYSGKEEDESVVPLKCYRLPVKKEEDKMVYLRGNKEEKRVNLEDRTKNSD